MAEGAYADAPVFDRFERVVDPTLYQPLPEDDFIGMTVDCSSEVADRVERKLAEWRERGILSFGAFRQKEALVTCIVPNVMHDDHMHFVDGAGGGYALAARMLKQSLQPA